MKDPEQLKEAIEALDGEFELVRELGQGATAVVYLLRDHSLERDVAMKVIRATFAGDDEAIARLQREARLVAQLTHPNIVKLYRTHRLSDGSFALLMEHVPGRNLKEILREEGAFPVPRAIRVLKDVASALAYAHRRRIVHRDVKPENIYIDEEVGAARLADFGVARPWDQDARLTLPGASLGTPAYMSPEQIDGQEVDGRSDVYSLGLVGYELLLGRHPWEGENVFTIIYKQKNDELPMEDLGLGDYPALVKTLESALEKEPERRLESAVSFLEKLTEVDGSAPLAPAFDPARAPEPQSDDSVGPVDWETVEGAGEDPPAAAVPMALDEAPETVQEDTPVLAPKRRSPLRRWGIPLAGLMAILAFGLFKWQPWASPTLDPGAFIPISSPPLETPAATEGPEEPAGLGSASLVALGGLELSGAVGSLLPVEVQATGGNGDPLVGELVLFSVVEGNGIFEREEVSTDSAGIARAGLRLPNRPGDMILLARTGGPDTLRTIVTVTAMTGSPSRVVPILGDGQSAGLGQTLPEALGVRVLDEFGNAIEGTEVRFQVLQGGGRIAPTAGTTDEDGRVFVRWSLGNTAGTQLVAAVVPGTEDALLTFQATAVAPSRPEPEPEPPPEEESPPGTPRVGPVSVVARTFAVGGNQACHLREGRAICRGSNDRGQGGDRSLSGLTALAVGFSHACGLDGMGGAWCWGANESGQLGDGSTRDRQAAGAVDTNARFSVLSGGRSHTCGLGAGGQAVCWGRNVSGQLGTGSREDHTRPAVVAGDLSFQDLAAGWDHTCGLASGNLYCWGSNGSGQLGDGTQVDRTSPTRVSGSFRAVAAGARHTCAIAAAGILCWGSNNFGQLGSGSTEDAAAPVQVDGLPSNPVGIAAGAVHTCAVLADRSVYCWGQNLHGQLGDGTNTNRPSPVAVSGGIEFVAVFAGGGATCGFARDGTEYCWGLNQNGQLGDGTRTSRSTPARVGGDTP